MTIDSLTLDQATNQGNNEDCDNYILGGIEPINWAYITRSGRLAGSRQPVLHRDLRPPRLQCGEPRLLEGPDDEPG